MSEEYLENTICEPTSAQALLERFEYALYRVGVGDAPADTSTDEALEIIAKFLDETIYGVFGADGFSDLNDSKVVIDVPVTF